MDAAWEWEPYAVGVDFHGEPDFEECFGAVPLLALGGRNTADQLEVVGLYEHLALIAQMAEPPQVRRILDIGSAAG